MNPVIVDKYRKVDWIFAVYQDIELISIYLLTPLGMESYYQNWNDKWHKDGKKDINNPKVPLAHVVEVGDLLWGTVPPKIARRRVGDRTQNPDLTDLADLI